MKPFIVLWYGDEVNKIIGSTYVNAKSLPDAVDIVAKWFYKHTIGNPIRDLDPHDRATIAMARGFYVRRTTRIDYDNKRGE